MAGSRSRSGTDQARDGVGGGNAALTDGSSAAFLGAAGIAATGGLLVAALLRGHRAEQTETVPAEPAATVSR